MFLARQEYVCVAGAGLHRSPTFNYRMVHTGSLVLLCDYVVSSVLSM